jgi:hypothetical protein
LVASAHSWAARAADVDAVITACLQHADSDCPVGQS